MALQVQAFRAVQHTRELQRILAVPRRTWTEDSAASLAAELSSVLSRPAGRMVLKGIQGQALYEIGTQGGGFCPIRVGGGKTLISLLAPYILESRRPLLILPAKLIDKTNREMRSLAIHWPIPNFIRIVSYEILGRVQQARMLEQYQPDLIVADEVHKLKNVKAAVTKRVGRYMADSPGTQFVALSGTITKRSLKDWAHIIQWCLDPTLSPVPHGWSEVEDWADALDEKPNSGNPCSVGALVTLCPAEERHAPGFGQTEVRIAYRKRLTETAGVIATSDIFLGASLTIESLETDMGPDVETAFRILRNDWTTPDEWPLDDPLAVWRHARELALGFFYAWEPRPPQEWLAPRKEWSTKCRHILSTNRRNLDSLLQVTNAVDAGLYPEATQALAWWRQVRESFVPNTVPVWFDDGALTACAIWADRAPGIVWTEHTAFAEKLANLSGLAYYGKRGLARDGSPIEAHPPGRSLIASVASNAEGRNLQAFNRNLIVSCPPNGLQWEQILGRTHRDGQESDEVTFDVLITAVEHALAFEQATKDARYIEQSTGQAQKLLYADVMVPTPDELSRRGGYRWIK